MPRTVWNHAIKRVERRAVLLRDLDRSPERSRAEALLSEAVRTANSLYWLAFGDSQRGNA